MITELDRQHMATLKRVDHILLPTISYQHPITGLPVYQYTGCRHYMNAQGRELGYCYSTLTEGLVIFETPRQWADSFKTNCHRLNP